MVSPTSRLVTGMSVLATIIPSSITPRAIPEAWIAELKNEEDITGVAASSLNFHNHFEKHIIPTSLWTAVKIGLDHYYKEYYPPLKMLKAQQTQQL